MIQEVAWPVTMTDKKNLTVSEQLNNLEELGNYIEWWNSDVVKEYDEEPIVLTDALGRKLGGKIEYLVVVELYVISTDSQPES